MGPVVVGLFCTTQETWSVLYLRCRQPSGLEPDVGHWICSQAVSGQMERDEEVMLLCFDKSHTYISLECNSDVATIVLF